MFGQTVSMVMLMSIGLNGAVSKWDNLPFNAQTYDYSHGYLNRLSVANGGEKLYYLNRADHPGSNTSVSYRKEHDLTGYLHPQSWYQNSTSFSNGYRTQRLSLCGGYLNTSRGGMPISAGMLNIRMNGEGPKGPSGSGVQGYYWHYCAYEPTNTEYVHHRLSKVEVAPMGNRPITPSEV